MKPIANIVPLLTALLLLAGCGGGNGGAALPESYTVGEESSPALNTLVTLNSDAQFQQTQDEESDSVTYLYSQLTSGSETAQTYTQALETDCGYTIEPDAEGGSVDFSASSGQVLAVHETEDPEEVLLLTIQWEETSCSVTPSLTPADQLPQPESVTLKQAVEHIQSVPPEQLGLSGKAEDYLFVPQDGTVLLDDQPCYCVNVYQRQPYQILESFLLTLPDLQIYRLDRESGQATPVA